LGSEDDSAVERIGAVLGDKWTLERLLGVGGMGAVYAARHRNGARAAIKILHPRLAKLTEVRERFRREAYAANKVEHPGVVRVLDDDVLKSGPDEGSPYLVMELLEGESLQDRLERGSAFGERAFLELADRVLDILQVAHEAGVVHRDLKPENLFFAQGKGSGEVVKVLDFGLARLLQAQAITSDGLALGTPSFMSPEQAAGRIDEIDGRTDLFALAATGFRLRAGRRIHEADDAVELVKRMAQSPAPPLRSVAKDASAPYARVIDKALSFKREDRYADAWAMQADVRRALAELHTKEGRESRAQFASQQPPPLPAPPQEPAREPTIELSSRDLEAQPPPVYGLDESIRIPKRRSWLPLFALLVLAGVVGAKLLFDARRDASGGSPSTTPSAAPSAPVEVVDAGSPAAPDAGRPKPRPPGSHRPVPPRPAVSGAH
jgi:serine/threonine-protein kinase